VADGERTLLTFRVADRHLAVDPARVAEVVRHPVVTRVPHAPPGLSGVASVRGRIVPVVALGRLMGLAETTASRERLIILDGAHPVGLAVDEVTGLETGTGDRFLTEEGGFVSTARLDALLDSSFSAFRRGGAASRAAPQPMRAPSQERTAEIALLAFALADQPYALPLETVREVIATPSDLTKLPRTDAAMLGVANVRGHLTPVVSARVLLGLPYEPLGPDSRVVITVVGGSSVGVAVDRVSEILRAPADSIGAVPGLLNRAAGEARVAAMLRPSQGGLVAVLDPERLFAEESMAQVLEDASAATDPEDAAGAATFRRFLIFSLKDETYGVDIAAVEEVVALPPNLARLPKAPPYVLGVMSWRGQALPIIDQRRRFDLGDAAPNRSARVMVMRLEGLAAGFVVDSVTQIRAVPTAQLRPTPELAQEASRLFDHVADTEDGDGVILLVNPRELLDRAEADLLASLTNDAPPS
jgi:purine-binding chemotaxis protein CheW